MFLHLRIVPAAYDWQPKGTKPDYRMEFRQHGKKPNEFKLKYCAKYKDYKKEKQWFTGEISAGHSLIGIYPADSWIYPPTNCLPIAVGKIVDNYGQTNEYSKNQDKLLLDDIVEIIAYIKVERFWQMSIKNTT